MAEKNISYTVRDFQGVRTELINFTRTYYPDLVQNFNDAGIFSVMLDLNAAVTDNLNFQIDRSIQETVLQFARQKNSVYNIARTYGLKVPGQRPSVALIDFSITVPAFGDREDLRYCGILRRGSQVNGAGQPFETVYDIDFASPINAEGSPNRVKIPNFDSSGKLINYTIVKREVVVNGITKVYKRVITANDARPYLELFLPEKNVLGITSVLLKSGTQYSTIPQPQDFITVGPERWFEVDALVQDRVFIEDPTKVSDQPGIKVGRYITTSNKFISEYTPEGFCKMTFGGGNISAEQQLREFARDGKGFDLSRYTNNFAMGAALTPNTTLFVQYRIGGGLSSNLGINTINQIGTVSFAVNGPSDSVNRSVINSLQCNNVTAAIGGANLPTTDDVRNMVAFNFAAQNRAVTVNDYNSIIRTMPSQFGAPAKVAITEENNKIKIKMLSYDTSGSLTNVVSNTLKQNVANYLSNYRMINDYISIEAAETIDLSVTVDVVLDNSQNQGAVIAKVIQLVTEFFNPLVRELGQNVNISELRRIIQSENGIVSVSDVLFFNQVGGQYSSAQTSMPYSDPVTRQIQPTADTLFATPTQTYQIRYPNKDINIRVLNLKSVNFS
jgi:hypothetical protein